MFFNRLRQRIHDRRRRIFRYYDGRKLCAADPIRIALELHDHPTFLHRHLLEAANGDRDAQKIAAETASDVFRIPELQPDGSGLTISERVDLLLAFDLYLLTLKKKPASSPT